MTALFSQKPICAAALTIAALLLTSTAAAASDATGVWINDTGRGAIEIKPCGEALCGHVVWVKDGGDAKGCGRQIIGDAQPVKAGLWDNGWIYSPEKKKRYDVELKPLDEDRLRVTGYAGSKFFSKTMIWKRAPADLERCGTTTAKAETPTNNAPPAEPETKTAASTEAPQQSAAAEPKARLSPEANLRAELQKEADAAKAASKPSETKIATADDEPAEAAKAEGLDLGGLKLDKYLKRDNGSCQLDLPWVKVDFKCPE